MKKVLPGTILGIFWHRIGSRKTVPAKATLYEVSERNSEADKQYSLNVTLFVSKVLEARK